MKEWVGNTRDLSDLLKSQYERIFGKAELVSRAILPTDIGRFSWEWLGYETFTAEDYRVLGITGIWASNFFQVQLIYRGTIIARLVPWQENPYVILARPKEVFEIRASTLDNSASPNNYFFAFRGIMVERRGESIDPFLQLI
jgi:hypothetical protein